MRSKARLAAPVLLAHAEVTKNILYFQWVQNLGTPRYSVCICSCIALYGEVQVTEFAYVPQSFDYVHKLYFIDRVCPSFVRPYFRTLKAWLVVSLPRPARANTLTRRRSALATVPACLRTLLANATWRQPMLTDVICCPQSPQCLCMLALNCVPCVQLH